MTKKKNTHATATSLSTKEYAHVLSDVKKQIKEAQIKAALAANKELIKLYWSISKIIVEQQEAYSWGVEFY